MRLPSLAQLLPGPRPAGRSAHDGADAHADAAAVERDAWGNAGRPDCIACMDSGNCWICLGSHEKSLHRLVRDCPSCGDTRVCRYCGPRTAA